MKAFLVLNRVGAAGIGVIVNLHTTSLKKMVVSLLNQDRKKEAFELMFSKAMVETYVPIGTQPSVKPELTLVEGVWA